MSPLPKHLHAPQPLSGLIHLLFQRPLLPVLLGLLPIALLAASSFLLMSATTERLVGQGNETVTRVAGEGIKRELEGSLRLAQTFADLPSLKELVAAHDEHAVRSVLEVLVDSQDEVDRAFVADAEGLLWSDYPKAPESLGKNFAYRDWYVGVSATWSPYVSPVYRRHAEPQPLVVAIATPIHGDEEAVTGILVYQFRLDTLSAWMERIVVAARGHVFLLDHVGNVAAHPVFDPTRWVSEDYASLPEVQSALAGQSVATRYVDPLIGEEMVATFTPVRILPESYWVAVGQQPAREAFAPVGRLGLYMSIAVGVAALMTLVMTGATAVAQRREQHVNEQLGELTVALKQSNKELEDFVYIASHDLQEPLRKIIGFGEMLDSENDEAMGDEARDYLGRIKGAALRMRELINSLLAYSRLTTRAQPFAPVDLQKVAAEVVSDLEVAIMETGGEVDVGTLPTIDADAVQMRQLLQNLIGNALKFHRPEVPPRVKVRAEVLDSGAGAGPVCQIRVEDNGIGIEEKYLARIFQPFQRLHSREQYEGSGIGLAVCQKIVQRHDGRIDASSIPGQGTIFTVSL